MNEFYPRNKFGAIRGWLQAASTLLFPLRCRSCGIFIDTTHNGHICHSCYKNLTFLSKPHCPICGLMFLKSGGGSHPCADCRIKAPFFNKARSLVRYSDEIGHLIHTFKFNGDLSLLSTFGVWAEKRFGCNGSDVDYIVPVPLHTTRLKERGFNQSALLANQFFSSERHRVKHLLQRTKNTIPQTKLGGDERRRNLKDCFCLTREAQVKDKLIYLVDDVYTTGTTVNECAKVLIKAGASRVEVYTLAMVVKENTP